MSNNFDQEFPTDSRLTEREQENNITNSRKNRSFIDNILQINDEHAVKKLFEEYFYLHAEKNNYNRITWDELRFIIQEILQRTKDELILSEATSVFYQMYQLQYSSTMTPTSLEKKEEKQLFLKKAKSEQELRSKLKEQNTSKYNKKIRYE